MNSFIRKQAIKLYGSATGRQIWKRLETLNRTQWLTPAEMQAYQRQKLNRLVAYAYEFVPYYRRLFDQVGVTPQDIEADLAAFQQLPTLSKQIINDHFDELVSTDPSRQKDMSINHTGGSTGRRLTFMQDNNFRDFVTADIHRHIQWTGWQFGECHTYLYGAEHEAATQKAIRTRLMDWTLNRFVSNAYTVTEESLTQFVEDIRKKRPKVMFGYASAMSRFAEFVQQNQLDDIKFFGIISTAEVLGPYQRDLIESTFGCQVLDRYGTRELGGIGCECPHHTGLHISAENVYVEVLQEHQPVPVEEEGDIVVTNLNNYAMPFLRYHIEDLGSLTDRQCPCGRGLPLMNMVSGRASDLIALPDGRAIHRAFFSRIFFDMAEVNQFQVIQKTYDHLLVSLVENEKLSPEKLAHIQSQIKEAMGENVEIEVKILDSIPLVSSGKHRFVISEIEQ